MWSLLVNVIKYTKVIYSFDTNVHKDILVAGTCTCMWSLLVNVIKYTKVIYSFDTNVLVQIVL